MLDNFQDFVALITQHHYPLLHHDTTISASAQRSTPSEAAIAVLVPGTSVRSKEA